MKMGNTAIKQKQLYTIKGGWKKTNVQHQNSHKILLMAGQMFTNEYDGYTSGSIAAESKFYTLSSGGNISIDTIYISPLGLVIETKHDVFMCWRCLITSSGIYDTEATLFKWINRVKKAIKKSTCIKLKYVKGHSRLITTGSKEKLMYLLV